MSIQVNEFQHIPGENDAEYIKLLKEALERQKQITSKAIAKIKELSNYSESPNNWIPCSERLPKEEKKTYWVCTDGGHQYECRWTNVNMIWTHLTTDWHWNIFDIPQYSKITAWMPLPECYGGD